MRIIGMDIHRVAAEVVALIDGEVRRLGRIPMLRDRLEAFARVTRDDHVVIEAAGNAAVVVEVRRATVLGRIKQTQIVPCVAP